MTTIANQVIEFADKHIGDYKISNGQLRAKVCPICHGGIHEDKESFAIGLHNGAWFCHRGNHIQDSGVPERGSFEQLCNLFGEHYDGKIIQFNTVKQKQYTLPDPEMLKPLTPQIIEYFKSRGISETTLEANGISADENGNIVFPFCRDKVLTYVKMRKPYKRSKEDNSPKEWCLPNTEAIPFGMDNVSFNRTLYITEGMIDALSLYEAGIPNVISVPSGAKSLEFVTTCWEWLEKFKTFVIFGDNDIPGIEMINTLVNRLGEDRCLLTPEYPELVYQGKDFGRLCKDANEILCCYGPDALREIAESCKPAPIKGVMQVSDISYVDPMTIPRIVTGVPSLDRCIAGLAEGALTVVFGPRGSGKSTFASSIALRALQQEEKVCAYSGELSQYNFLNWIMLPACDRKYLDVRLDERSGRIFPVIPFEIQKRIKNWMKDKFWLLKNEDLDAADQAEAIINKFTMIARRWGVKLFICDNLMSVVATGDEELKLQTKFSNDLKKFATKYNAHVILVCHPRKTKQGEAYNNDSVAGSANITNVADNVICISKGKISVTKNREFGDEAEIITSYDPATRRIFETAIGDKTVYNWDHSNLDVELNNVDKYEEFKVKEPEELSDPF